MKNSKLTIKNKILVMCLLLSCVFGGIGPVFAEDDILSDKLMKVIIENNLPGTVVGVVKEGQVVFLESFGDADKLSNVALSVDETAFQAGSLSRVFTSYALVQLLESKGLSQETPIENYLPEALKNKEAFKNLTFHNVLMQTTGIPSLKANTAYEFSPYGKSNVSFGKEAVVFLEKYKHMPVIKPNTYILPSNVNSILAGVLIEQISAKTYEAYLADEVFIPLMMRDTANMILGKHRTGSHAVNYNIFGGVLTPASPFTAKFLASDDVLTTGQDMAKFMSHQSDTLEALFSTKGQNTAGFVGKSIGFSVLQYQGKELFLQDGGVPGSNARMVFIPNESFALFLYYNVDNLEAKDAIMDVVLNHYFSLKQRNINTEAYVHENLDIFEGIYIPTSASEETVERLMQIIHQIKVKPDKEGLWIDNAFYIPLSETVFYNEKNMQIVEFKADEGGKLSHLITGNQVYKHGSVFRSFFIQVSVLGFALFFNMIALLIILSKWSNMKLHRVHETPRMVLLLHTGCMTLLMTMLFIVSVNYNYWDVIFDRASVLQYIRWVAIATGIFVLPTFFVLRQIKEDFRWSAPMRFVFNIQFIFSIFLIIWLVNYNLI